MSKLINPKTSKTSTNNDATAARQTNKEELSEIRHGMPIDYSFKNLKSLEDANKEQPRALRVGGTPKRSLQKKFLTRSIWLNNNNLENFKALDSFINAQLQIPDELGWLDLSFNRIQELDETLGKYKQIKILYLHANNISDLNKLDVLTQLPKLRTLTLHGNPIEALPNYRLYIINKFPQVLSLDFATVVPSERTTVFTKRK